MLLTLLVLFSGQAMVSAQTTGPQAAGPQTSVTGTFAMMSGDGEDGATHQYVFTVTDSAGTMHRVAITEAVGEAAGGVTNLSGKKVTVTGTAQGAPEGGGPAVIGASSITVVGDAAATPSATPEALAGAQKFATVLCRFSDSIGTTPKTPAYVQGLLSDTYPGISHFWRENSYNLINNVGSVVKGWYNLPQPRSFYVFNNAGQPGIHFDRLARDCTAQADPTTNFNDYVGINLLFNQNLDCCAWGGGMTLTLDGTNKVWPMTWMPPWGYASQRILGHEMGHAYGLPHSSGNYGNVYDSQWDVMSGGGGSLGAIDPTYGRLGTHTIAYHKDKLGWIAAGRKYTAPVNSCKEIAIDHLEQVPGTSGNFLMAQIPVSATRFYTVEARKFKGYDTNRIPGQAIIIHDVVTTRNEPAHVMDATNDGNTNDAGAQWVTGETFTDAGNGVKIQIGATTTNGWLVKITRGSGVCAAPPAAPITISPNSTGVANPVTYRWNSSAGASWYRIYVSGPGGVREAWFPATTAGCAAGGVCAVTPTGNAENNIPWALANNSNYTWWALGWNAAGYGPWSSGKAFTVGPPVAPTLISPSAVSAPNPVTYRWNSSQGATWYRLYITGPGGVRQQWFTASAAGCSAGGVCSLTPTGNAEAGVPWQLTSGSYTWWALGWNSQGAGLWSTSRTFTGVYGFDSQFTNTAPGWASRVGAWSFYGGGYLTSTGNDNAWNSVYYSNSTFANFSYEAQLWRNGSATAATNIIVRGNPTSVTGDGAWTNQYVFQYSRDGFYSVWKTVGGVWTAIKPWTFSTAVAQNSAFNTLRATVNGSSMWFTINGTTLWSGTDASFSAGSAGVGFFDDAAAGTQLWINWAKLTSPVAPTTVSAEQGATAQSGSNDPTRSGAGTTASAAQSAPEGSASVDGTLPPFDAPQATGEAPPSEVVAPPA